MVYIDNPTTPKRRQGEKTSVEYPSVKLQLKKSETYQFVRAKIHTVTIDMDGLHNIDTIDRETLARAAYKIGHGMPIKTTGKMPVTTGENSKDEHKKQQEDEPRTGGDSPAQPTEGNVNKEQVVSAPKVNEEENGHA